MLQLLPDAPNDFESQLSTFISQPGFNAKTQIRTIRHDDVSRVITEESKYFDLVILRSIRRPTVGGLAVGNVTIEVIQDFIIWRTTLYKFS